MHINRKRTCPHPCIICLGVSDVLRITRSASKCYKFRRDRESLFLGQYPVVFARWAAMKSITSHNNNDDNDDGGKHFSYCWALFQVFSHVNSFNPPNSCVRYVFFKDFRDEEIEAQGSSIPWPRSLPGDWWHQEWNPACLTLGFLVKTASYRKEGGGGGGGQRGKALLFEEDTP